MVIMVMVNANYFKISWMSSYVFRTPVIFANTQEIHVCYRMLDNKKYAIFMF